MNQKNQKKKKNKILNIQKLLDEKQHFATQVPGAVDINQMLYHNINNDSLDLVINEDNFDIVPPPNQV